MFCFWNSVRRGGDYFEIFVSMAWDIRTETGVFHHFFSPPGSALRDEARPSETYPEGTTVDESGENLVAQRNRVRPPGRMKS